MFAANVLASVFACTSCVVYAASEVNVLNDGLGKNNEDYEGKTFIGSDLDSNRLHSELTVPQIDVTELHSNINRPHSELKGSQLDFIGPQSAITGLQSDLIKSQSEVIGPQSDFIQMQSELIDTQLGLTGPQSTLNGTQSEPFSLQSDHTVPQPTVTDPQLSLIKSQSPLNEPQSGYMKPQTSLIESKTTHNKPQSAITGSQSNLIESQAIFEGPHLDLIGPQLEFSGLQTELTGKQSYLNGPQLDLTGPRPVVIDPQPSLIGSQFSLTGSQSSFTRSQPALINPQSALVESQLVNRRALGDDVAAPPQPESHLPLSTASKPKRFNIASVRPQGGKKPVVVGEEKMDRLRTFLDKYKAIVSDFMANRSAPPPPANEEPALRAPHARRPELPSGAQLDLAPARGGSIHSLRNKNRLCHRHVMIPEGPKYDSKGRIYLTEYVKGRNKEYDATTAPHLLLPKCCNCCRKSILGCE